VYSMCTDIPIIALYTEIIICQRRRQHVQHRTAADNSNLLLQSVYILLFNTIDCRRRRITRKNSSSLNPFERNFYLPEYGAGQVYLGTLV